LSNKPMATPRVSRGIGKERTRASTDR
jgi:hypothetical protein